MKIKYKQKNNEKIDFEGGDKNEEIDTDIKILEHQMSVSSDGKEDLNKKKKKKYVKRYIRRTPMKEPFVVRDNASDSPYFSLPERDLMVKVPVSPKNKYEKLTTKLLMK